jgi:hypothetical protein
VTDVRTTVRIETVNPPTLAETAACLVDLSVLADAAFVVVFAADVASAPEPELREVRAGSLVVELLTAGADARVVEALGLFGSLVTAAPWLAGLPHRVREHWYRHAALAEGARIAYEDLRTHGRVEVKHVQVPSRAGRHHRGRRPTRPGRRLQSGR